MTPLPPSSHAKPVDSFLQATELEKELKRAVRGEVRFDRGSRALYATDGSNYRQIPIGLVIPRDAEDVVAAVAACRKYGAPVLPRGAGTSLAGQCCNVAVVLDFTKYMNQVIEIDPRQMFARVQPGLVLDTLQSQTLKHQLMFAPDPSTHNRCTIGRMTSCAVSLRVEGVPPRFTGTCKGSAIPTAIWYGNVSHEFLGGFPDTTSTNCCPKEDLTLLALWWERRALASLSSKPS